MKKKGFTLVELLAVIAILAILVIFVLPNVIEIYNNSRKDVFVTEVKSVASAAKEQYMTNEMLGKEIKRFTSTDNKLELDGNKLDYCVLLDDEGEISKLSVSNGIWVVTISDSKDISQLTKDDIVDGGIDVNKCSISNNFSTDSWETIIEAVKADDTINYNVGDTRILELDLDEDGALEEYTLRLYNKTKCSKAFGDLTNKSHTACGFVIGFENSVGNMPFGVADHNSYGWPGGERYKSFARPRYFTNVTLYNLFPNTLKEGIINTTVISGHGCGESDNFISVDKLYLLTLEEVFGDSFTDAEYDTSLGTSRQLDYLKNNNVTVSGQNSINIGGWSRSAYGGSGASSGACQDNFIGYGSRGYGNADAGFGRNEVYPFFRLSE